MVCKDWKRFEYMSQCGRLSASYFTAKDKDEIPRFNLFTYVFFSLFIETEPRLEILRGNTL